MTADKFTYMRGDDGSLSVIDTEQFRDEVNTILALLFDSDLTGAGDFLAGEQLQKLWDATSPAYVRQVALAVAEEAGRILLMGLPFLLFSVACRRFQFLVMAYRRLRPEWEEEAFRWWKGEGA